MGLETRPFVLIHRCFVILSWSGGNEMRWRSGGGGGSVKGLRSDRNRIFNIQPGTVGHHMKNVTHHVISGFEGKRRRLHSGMF